MSKHSHFVKITVVLALTVLSPVPAPGQNQAGKNPGDTRLDQLQAELVSKAPTEALLQTLQELIAKEPKNSRAHLIMGAALDKAGLPNDAIEQYRLAVQYGPDSPKAVIELVKALITAKQADPALRLLTAAHSRFPDDPEITYWVGKYFFNKGDIKAAEKNYLQAQKGSKTVQGLGVGLAEVRLSQGNFKEALRLAEAELTVHPENSQAQSIKGLALFDLQHYAEAIEPLRTAFLIFTLKPGVAKTYSQALWKTRRMQAALEPAVVAFAVSTDQYNQDRDASMLLYMLIRILPSQVVHDQVPGFSDRLDKLMKNPTMHLGLGSMLEAQGFRDLATREYYKAVKLDPGNFDACVRLANNLELYYQKYDEAQTYFAMAHALRANDEQVADRLIRLQNRLPARSGDMAWLIKDMIRKQRSPID